MLLKYLMRWNTLIGEKRGIINHQTKNSSAGPDQTRILLFYNISGRQTKTTKSWCRHIDLFFKYETPIMSRGNQVGITVETKQKITQIVVGKLNNDKD